MLRLNLTRTLWLLLLVSLGALVALLLDPSGGAERRQTTTLAKSVERELAREARAAFLQKVYAPVEGLRESGNPQGALLKLDELERSYPGEAHNFVLRGEILRSMQVLDQAIANFVRAVKLSGDYLDERGPLSRRTEIRQLVDEGLQTLLPKAKAHPDNASLAAAVKDLYYLQSRLAGGCE